MPHLRVSVGKRCMVSHSRICTTLACLIAVAVMVPAFASPEPAAAPVSWEFQMKPTIPFRITASTKKGNQTYWYFLYKVVNNTGEDRPFHPEIVRVNQIMSEVPADKAREKPGDASSITVDPAIVGLEKSVFEAIKERHKATHPFLMHPVDAITTLRQAATTQSPALPYSKSWTRAWRGLPTTSPACPASRSFDRTRCSIRKSQPMKKRIHGSLCYARRGRCPTFCRATHKRGALPSRA